MWHIRLPFNAQDQQSLEMSEMGALDPNAYVEPMELYDSIFWGKLVLLSECYLGQS